MHIFSFLRAYQLDIMLFLSGMCGIMAFMTLINTNIPVRKKAILALMEFSAMALLLSDRAAYIYRGNTGTFGTFAVRYSNALVFFLILIIPGTVTLYLKGLFSGNRYLNRVPKTLYACEVLFFAGTATLCISQFTGLYYTFTDNNLYVRSPWYPLSYVFPFSIVLLQALTVIRYRHLLGRPFYVSLLVNISFPSFMSVLQIFCYGVSLISMSVVFVVISFHIYALHDLSREVVQARENEINALKESELKEMLMFEQTAEALVSAIDAKDEYTRGHSLRVAVLSRKIAERAGFDRKTCGLIYYSALLHDIGKIGVKDAILNKKGKLTDEEFEQIKMHTVFGYHILSSIKQSPMLSIGAHYHHEHYDGSGYPDGLAGDDIPVMARVIAVADAYDTMASTRIYRKALPSQTIEQELVNGKGTQFDPRFADVLLEILAEENSTGGSSAST